MNSSQDAASGAELAARFARLWPHREHEASSILGFFCRAGVHRWKRLDLATLSPGRDIAHCFWCSKVKVDGIVHNA